MPASSPTSCPRSCPTGSYDVTVELGDGRLATATDAFVVTPGDWPVGYTIDMIGNQTSGIPFGVTLRAQGAPGRRDYGGTVNLSVPGATVTPTISGPFTAGRAGGGHHRHRGQLGHRTTSRSRTWAGAGDNR